MTDSEDIKAKMREALDRKKAQQHDDVEDRKQHKETGHGPDSHGPLGGVHMHRRKAGGGGS